MRSLEEYTIFVQASSSQISATPRKVKFDPEFIPPGRYFLVYFGRRNCVLAKSKEFQVTHGGMPYHGGF